MVEKLLLSICCSLVFLTCNLSAQDLKIKFSDRSIREGEIFTVTLTVPTKKVKEISPFPEIEDFSKKRTIFHRERKEDVFIAEQEYLPSKPGVFTLPSFTISVNGQTYRFNGTKITVVASGKKSPEPITEDKARKKEEFSPSELDAMFVVESNQKTVFVNEGFVLSASFLVAKDNPSEYNFVDLNKQVTAIIQDLKPADCWIEEITTPGELKKDTVKFHNKIYNRYRLYKVCLFPLGAGTINIPSTSFKILTYATLRTKNEIERKDEFKMFKSGGIAIQVLPLPDHPLMDSVAVGIAELQTNIWKKVLEVNEPLKVSLKLTGKFNPALAEMNVKESPDFEIYPEKEDLKKEEKGGDVQFTKVFNYEFLPKNSGNIKLADCFSLIYFNTSSKTYDTLTPKFMIYVKGERKSEYISSHEDGFYQLIDKSSNKLRQGERDDLTKILTNIIILFMLVTTIILIIKR
jgi:hypothetical protein